MAEKKEKQYVSDNAQLMAEWNWAKNIDLNPSQLALGSNKKVWWKCKKGHEWQAVISDRNRGHRCPYCSGKYAIKGESDLQTVNPMLAKEWNYQKNNELTPMDVLPNSNKVVWWICNHGHEWQASISNRSKGTGCPYCSGRCAIKGKNDLQTINPSLAKEWNDGKNGNLKPENVTANSSQKAWWVCNHGHEWQATIDSRSNGNGCPYCANQKVLKGYNDLSTLNPGLAQEWNNDRNGNLKPENVTPNSNKTVWWKCSRGHEWKDSINHRNHGRGCPYCSGQRVLIGYNDLKTINPQLAHEWNYARNGKLKPEDFTANSGQKVWWICKKGHEWRADIKDRNKGSGCPICNSERSTSFPEYAIVYYLRKYDIEVLHSYKEFGYELDIYIPSLKIAIEYDGSFWHRNKTNKDLEKNRKCEKDGITLFRIREGLAPLNDSSIDFIIHDRQKDLPQILEEILRIITEVNVDIDLKRDAIDIENLREYTEKANSLQLTNPSLVVEWNYEKNGKLRPDNITANSNKKVWWICEKKHEWQAVVASRNKGIGCPYCAGRYAIKGQNDLQTVNPALAKEWNHAKNEGLMPTDVTPNSQKKVWWICSKGHEWQAMILNRNRGTGCPACYKQSKNSK